MKIDKKLLLEELQKTRYISGYNLNKLLKLATVIFLIIAIPLIVCKLNSIYLIAWRVEAMPLTAPFIEKWIYGLAVIGILLMIFILWSFIFFVMGGLITGLIISLIEFNKWIKN